MTFGFVHVVVGWWAVFRCVNIPSVFIYFALNGCLGWFRFWLLWLKWRWTFLHGSFWGQTQKFLLGKIPRSGIAEGGVYLGNSTWFSRGVVPLVTLTGITWESLLSCILAALMVFSIILATVVSLELRYGETWRTLLLSHEIVFAILGLVLCCINVRVSWKLVNFHGKAFGTCDWDCIGSGYQFGKNWQFFLFANL